METLNTPHLLVIGGTGFIGHHLLRAAHKKSWQITSVSRNPPSSERFVEGVRYLHLDLTQQPSVNNLLNEDFEYVVNLGGYINHQLFKDGGRELIDMHFTTIQNLVKVLPRHKLKRFVQIGSSDEYGNAKAPQHEILREEAISPYSLGKVASTHFLQMLHRTENFPVVILRLFLTYGSGQNSERFLPQIIQSCLNDDVFPTSVGKQLRDFCYVDDTIRAIFKALIVPEAKGEVVNVASGIAVSIRTMIKTVCTLTGSGKPCYGEVPYRPGENIALYANINKAKSILLWEPKVSLKDGLIKTIDSFSTN